MGKISDALEKAGAVEPREKRVEEELDEETQITEQFNGNSLKSETSVENQRQVQNDALSTPTFSSQQTAIGEAKLDERLSKAIFDEAYIPEIFKTLRSRILLPENNAPIPKSIMITSVEPKEGKSFITANLGISLAEGVDQHCLLVGCDLRRPSLSNLFGLRGDYGLVNYLRGEENLDNLIQKTPFNKLSVLASGKEPSNPAELLGASRMKSLVAELAERYNDRIVIYDSPPYQLAAETALLAELMDKVILVIRHGIVGRHQVKKLIDKIGSKKFLGLVFNGHETNFIDRVLMKGYDSYSSGYASKVYS